MINYFNTTIRVETINREHPLSLGVGLVYMGLNPELCPDFVNGSIGSIARSIPNLWELHRSLTYVNAAINRVYKEQDILPIKWKAWEGIDEQFAPTHDEYIHAEDVIRYLVESEAPIDYSAPIVEFKTDVISVRVFATRALNFTIEMGVVVDGVLQELSWSTDSE